MNDPLPLNGSPLLRGPYHRFSLTHHSRRYCVWSSRLGFIFACSSFWIIERKRKGHTYGTALCKRNFFSGRGNGFRNGCTRALLGNLAPHWTSFTGVGDLFVYDCLFSWDPLWWFHNFCSNMACNIVSLLRIGMSLTLGSSFCYSWQNGNRLNLWNDSDAGYHGIICGNDVRDATAALNWEFSCCSEWLSFGPSSLCIV